MAVGYLQIESVVVAGAIDFPHALIPALMGLRCHAVRHMRWCGVGAASAEHAEVCVLVIESKVQWRAWSGAEYDRCGQSRRVMRVNQRAAEGSSPKAQRLSGKRSRGIEGRPAARHDT